MPFINNALGSINKSFLNGSAQNANALESGEFDKIFSKSLDELDAKRGIESQLRDLTSVTQPTIDTFGTDSELETTSSNTLGLQFDMAVAFQKLEEARIAQFSLPPELATKFTALKNGRRLSPHQIQATMDEFYGYSKAIITTLSRSRSPEEKLNNEKRLNRTIHAQFLGVAYYGRTEQIDRLIEYLDNDAVPDSIKAMIKEGLTHLSKQDKIAFKGLGLMPDAVDTAKKTHAVQAHLYEAAKTRTDLTEIIDNLGQFSTKTTDTSTSSTSTEATAQ